jgi:hypothetical protein
VESEMLLQQKSVENVGVQICVGKAEKNPINYFFKYSLEIEI